MTHTRHDTPSSRVTCAALGLLVAGLLEEPFDFDAAGPSGEPSLVISRR